MLLSTFGTNSFINQETTYNSTLTQPESPTNDLIFRHNDLTIIKTLYDSRFPVYIVSSSQTNQRYAMKVFPWEDNNPSPYYLQEVRFASLHHFNIISIPYFKEKAQFLYDNQYVTVSYIVMEYAQYGDFSNAVNQYMIPFHDKLLRTYFHQLIEGLECFHSNGAAHLDIKPDNLLIADDYTLKIADFDLSYMHEDGQVWTKGTKNFRAPEIFNQQCNDPQAADIYSAGMVLFYLKTRGTLPYVEDSPTHGVDMLLLKDSDPELFWENLCTFGDRHPSFFTEDFKELFQSMMKFDPTERATIEQIKNSKWYQKDTYSTEELADFMKGRFDL